MRKAQRRPRGAEDKEGCLNFQDFSLRALTPLRLRYLWLAFW